jgi:hypothetical protein
LLCFQWPYLFFPDLMEVLKLYFMLLHFGMLFQSLEQYIVFFGFTGDWPPDLKLTQPTLYHLSHALSHWFHSWFPDRVTLLPRTVLDLYPLSATSHVAGIMDISHHDWPLEYYKIVKFLSLKSIFFYLWGLIMVIPHSQ